MIQDDELSIITPGTKIDMFLPGGFYFDVYQLVDRCNRIIEPLKPNFANRQYIQAYMSLFSGTGKENRDEGNEIAHEDYPKGYALYAFDLSPDLAE